MKRTQKITLSALFLALGIVLPFFTGQIPKIGNLLLPMHIPVLFCGFLCGMPYGFLVGFLTPILRSILFSMPPMMPKALGMAVELAVYGIVTGVLYPRWKQKKFGIYSTLLTAMILGRMTWGIASFLLYKIVGMQFTWELFIAGAFFNALPGIIIQLILIPAVLYRLQKTNTYVQ